MTPVGLFFTLISLAILSFGLILYDRLLEKRLKKLEKTVSDAKKTITNIELDQYRFLDGIRILETHFAILSLDGQNSPSVERFVVAQNDAISYNTISNFKCEMDEYKDLSGMEIAVKNLCRGVVDGLQKTLQQSAENMNFLRQGTVDVSIASTRLAQFRFRVFLLIQILIVATIVVTQYSKIGA